MAYFILIIALNLLELWAWAIASNPKQFAGHLNNPDLSFYDNIAPSTEESSIVHIQYSISFPIPTNNHCPIIYFHHKNQEELYGIAMKCFTAMEIENNREFDKHYRWFENCGNVYEQLDICSTDEENNQVNCKDSFKKLLGFKSEWNITVGHKCNEKNVLDLKYNITITYLEKFQQCMPFNMQDSFHKSCMESVGYLDYGKPNMMGYTSKEVVRSTNIIVQAFIGSKCYQHFLELACLTLYPVCDPKTKQPLMVPCKQLCLDWVSGCEHLLQTGVKTNCTTYPDSLDPDVCYYKPVVCSYPDLLQHGNMTLIELNVTHMHETEVGAGTIVRYACEAGYILTGESESTCLYGGFWSNQTPNCTANTLTAMKLKILSASVPTGISIVLIISLITLRKFWLEIRTLIRHSYPFRLTVKCGCKLMCYARAEESQTNNKFDGFVVYDYGSSHDKEYVLKLVESNSCNDISFCTESELECGRPLVASIEEGIYTSGGIIILLSEDSINSEYFENAFQYAQERNSQDSQFKMIVVDFGIDHESAGQISANVLRYIKIGSKFGFVLSVRQNHPLMYNMIDTYLNS